MLAGDLFEFAHKRCRDPTAAERLIHLELVNEELRRVPVAAWELMGEDVTDGLLIVECNEIHRPFVSHKVGRVRARQRPLAAQLNDDFLISGAQSANCQVSSTALRRFAGALSQ